MLSKWRKDVREGLIRGRAPTAPPPGPARKIAQLRALGEGARAPARGAGTPKKRHSVLFRSKGDRFAFIDTQRTRFGVVSLCRRYHVTTQGVSAWLDRSESAHATQDRVLTKEIARLFALHKERYGSPRIHQALGRARWWVSRRRVAHLMRVAGRRAKAVQGYRANANIHQLYARHPNRLWAATVTGPNQVWVGDITFLTVGSQWRYLAIVMNPSTRRILAGSLTRRRTAAVTSAILALAAARRPTHGAIFHSDRGSEYMGAAFCATVARLGMHHGANVSGPSDNAHAESIQFGKLPTGERGSPSKRWLGESSI